MKNYIYSERANLFEPNIYINFLVQISGNPSLDDLVSAVKIAFNANEATMSKIILEKDGTAFYEKMEDSGCNVMIAKRDWQDLIRENEKVPFNINEGELIRVFVNTSDEKTSLLIMAHHLVGDGKSVVYFLEDVMKALSGQTLEYKPMHLITKDYFPKESKLPLFFKLYANSFNRKWQKDNKVFTWDDYHKIHDVYWKEHTSQVVYETFSPKEIEKIRFSSKKMGVTINTFITTAFLKADKNNGEIGIAVDARTSRNQSMSNQTTGISLNHTYSEKVSFAENSWQVHKKIQKKLKRPALKYFVLQFMSAFTPTLIDSVLLYTYNLHQNKTTSKLAKILGYKGGKTRELGITNLTKLDIPNTYGAYKLNNVLFIPPVVSYAKHIIGISTIEDELTISYHFMNIQDELKEKEFFKRAIANIRLSLK